MKYRKLGKSGIEASAVALGTWAIGGGSVWGGTTDDEESIRTIHAALDEGINLIDTAPAYGFGRSEKVVGLAVRDRRDKVVIATKCGLWWEDDRGSPMGEFDGVFLRRSLRPDTIRLEVEKSLLRLGTDYIDLYQTHWPAVEPEKTPVADTMGCLMDLKREGKIRAIGASNVTLPELREYEAAGGIDTNQPRYSMLYREIEEDVLPWCLKHDVAILAYMPLEQGLLTGMVDVNTRFEPGDWRTNYQWNPWYKVKNRPRVLSMLGGWAEITKKYSCTLAQMVIAWTIAQPGVTHALCGARRVQHIRETAQATEVELTEEDIERISGDIDALGEPS